ncbi:uncharacterized protein LOC114022600 isoform X5 [Chelonia mydas]|uniref:uncharacterized protein LOC114022600 isoform X5 n=1 Tax=Chelonia mydas TaxID=8469 RepID=UPI0018A20B60|nr:uncharacterized protein LOC114022600 isoform X5 [Chelonia mydas]
MEEAPQGTFQDELEWCILQLETGLLHLNPTPKQGLTVIPFLVFVSVGFLSAAEETRHILKILRSHKAAFVKKRQVMNRVFGDYRLKMAEERKRTEKAAMKPGKAQIQQGKAQASGSMVYRKRSGQTSESTTNWFTPSDNSFQFSFALPEMDPQATNGTLEEAQGVGGSEQRPISVSSLKSSSSGGVLNFSTTGQEPKFAFNFVIPDKDGPMMPSVVTGQRAESVAENVTSDGLASAGPMKHSTLLEANMPEVVGCVGGGLGREALIFETPKPEIASVDEVKAGKTAAAGAPKKKKKKKKPSNSKKEMAEAEVSKKVKVGASGCEDTDLSLQDKTMQQSVKQLWKEVDWCVEQLELGLKTQKSTPKQAEEALHAIKTLRSDKAVLAKKCQVMRAMFGDYKKKMEEERQKQLKIMQAAAKSAQVVEVRENARRKSSQVFRKRSEASRKSPSSAGSPFHPPSHPESPQVYLRHLSS